MPESDETGACAANTAGIAVPVTTGQNAASEAAAKNFTT
jgi:hypothetical protein